MIERISPNVVLEFNKGSNVKINYYCIAACQCDIQIGEGTEFGPSVYLYDHDHDYRKGFSSNSDKECFKKEPIKIGKNCWIGANTLILKGTEIGDNCVVAAGTIVKGTFEDNTVICQKRKYDTRKIFGEIQL